MAEQRVVWITGAGSGMGRAAALEAARSGWTVALTGRSTESLRSTAELIETQGGAAAVLPADVRDADAVRAAALEIDGRWGRIDAVVASAGLNAPKRGWADQSMSEFEAILDTNLTAVARVVDAALPRLRTSHGVVVVVSSYSAWSFTPYAGVAYSASKTALAALCRTLNVQEAGSGIRATHLCPGDVNTEFLTLRPTVPDERARAGMLTPDDVGRAIGFVLESPAHVRIDELVISPVSQA